VVLYEGNPARGNMRIKEEEKRKTYGEFTYGRGKRGRETG